MASALRRLTSHLGPRGLLITGLSQPVANEELAMSNEESSEVQPPVTIETAMAATDGAYTLFVAEFADTTSAWEAYEALKSIEDGRRVEIEGVVVVKRDADGTLKIQKATDHSTKHGLKWGIVGGIALGVIFPPTILGSAAFLGGVGTGVGKLRQLHRRSQLEAELGDAIAPGHSGILALVSDPAVVEIRKALAVADAIVESTVDRVLAADIKAAAKEAQDDEASPAAETTGEDANKA